MDIKNASTTQLKKIWNKHKNEEGASPVFGQQLKNIAKELKSRGEKLNEQTNFMNQDTKKSIQQFIGNIANKDYSSAQNSLQQVVAEKIKNKVRDHVKFSEK
jgi:uncharacterized protein YaaR (DUF327 family)